MVAQNNDNRAVILEQALTRFVDECLQGDKPNIDEFVKQYPQCETQLKRRIRDLKEIDFLFDSLIRADEVEFGATTSPQDLVGQKLASFDVERVIGQGGMGVVYLARDTKLDRQVAIKSMPAGLLSSSKAQARFKSEAKLLASLNHPNIAVIYDIIEEQEGSSYLVLEYVPGETLAERIACEPLELEEALSISGQIAEAVSAAHKKDIIHRDLKPSNIKITPEGRVKVLDFGLAKTYDRNSKGSKTDAIQPGRVIGTPAYMSPEQAQGKETDHRTDIWSFGCIMFEMLTGRHPFECETAKDTLQSIIKHQPDWNLLPENIPTNIRVLLKRCLDKDPSRRHENITNASIEISNTLTKPVTSSVETVPTRLRRMRMVMGTIGVIFLIGAAMWFGLNKVNESSAKVIRLVVLPFENLGSANDENYSNVISAGIISHLVGLRGLAVSSEKMTDERAVLLGKKSSINYVLKGTIQCVQGSDPNSRVMRIRPQLIRVSDGQYVWAEPYDKNVSQIYRIPSELAEEVAYAMNVPLRDSERQAIASLPTENKEAYAYYLRGSYYSSQSYQIESNLSNAVQLYEKAVEEDDRFALAYAKLSQAYTGMYRWEYDRSEKRLAMAKKAVDKALALDPKLPEVHWALGFYYYWGYRECDQALKHFAVARKGRPNDSRLIAAMAYAQRAQGKLDQALINIKKAHELSPIDPVFATELGKTLMDMRKYEEAAHYCKRAIELGPDQPKAYEWMASIYLRQKGDRKKTRDILEDALQHIKSIDDTEDIVYLLGTIDIYEENYQEALDRLDVESEDIETMDYNKALRCARIYRYLNEEDIARKYFESAQKNIEKQIKENSGNYWLYSHLGIAYAGLGLKEEAVQMGKRATQLLPITKNSWWGTFPIEFLANIDVMVGDYDAALDQIQYLLSVPGRLSINILKLDPAWKSLHNHPRFQKLIESAK
jgi:serine/threonine protein kinase/tetratricopeptide (TPR) repeat protein